MLKVFKKLFSYKKPSQTESGFELLEESQESSAWSRYRGKESNLQNVDNSKAQNPMPQEQNQAMQEQDNQSYRDRSEDVRGKLLKIINESRSTVSKNSTDSAGNQGGKQAQGSQSGDILDLDNEEGNTDTKDQNQDNTLQSKASGRQTGMGREPQDKEGQKSGNSSGKEKRQNHGGGKGNEGENEDSASGKEGANKNKRVKDARICYKIPLTFEELIKNNKGKEKKKTDDQTKRGEKNKNSEKEEKEECGDKNAGNKKEGNASSNNGCISTSLEENIMSLKKIFHIPLNQDVVIREFNVARTIPACVVFIDGMIDKSIVIQFTLPQLMDVHPFSEFEGGCPMDYIEKNIISINQIVRMKTFKEIVPQILSGLTALFVDGCDECIVMESRGFETRSVGSPATEAVVQGAQEGFTENLRTNITLVRRIVKNENLITEFDSISRSNNFLTALLYVKGIVNPKIIDEVKRRIKSIDIDYVSGAGMEEQLIEDKSMMLFPQIISTERPDRVASFLMEGKAVLICEGTPFALAMPITFFDLFHTSEDSNLRWQYGSFLRIIRLIGLILGLLLPGMYTALILYHQEMIPTGLLSSIVASRSAVPFPTILEILLLEFSFELIREGGIRVPGVIGNALGIIGAIILGQAAVEAGLVSPILIIVVAITGLGTFAIPNYSLAMAIRITRFAMIIFGKIAGFYGVSAAFTILCALVLGMKSFGVPFFSPIAPLTRSNKDEIIREPIYAQTKRPDYLNTQNEEKAGKNPRGWAASAEGGDTGDASGR